MLKFVSVGLVMAAIGFASIQTAQARHRNRWNNYCCCPSVATATAAPGTVQAVPVPPSPTGQLTQSYEQPYRSYSADAVPPAPANTGVFNNSNDRGNEYRSFSADPVPPMPAGSSGVFNNANESGNTYSNYYNYYGNTRSGFGGGMSTSRGGTAGSPVP